MIYEATCLKQLKMKLFAYSYKYFPASEINVPCSKLLYFLLQEPKNTNSALLLRGKVICKACFPTFRQSSHFHFDPFSAYNNSLLRKKGGKLLSLHFLLLFPRVYFPRPHIFPNCLSQPNRHFRLLLPLSTLMNFYIR